MTLNQQPTASW